jgi:hypothetical protein
MDQFDTTLRKPCRIRTQPFTYGIFGILIGPIFIAWVYIACSSRVVSNRVGAVVAGSILTAIWLWFFFFEVDLYSDRLVIKTLLGRREVNYSDIRKVDIVVRSSRGATGRGWVIYDSRHFATRPLKIPIGPLRGRDQRKIAQTLVDKVPTARIDSWTRSMATSGK